jgi:hypothetical protein
VGSGEWGGREVGRWGGRERWGNGLGGNLEMEIAQILAIATPCSVSSRGLWITETLILSLNPAGALRSKGFRGFSQGLIESSSYLWGGWVDPDENGDVECRQGKGSRARPSKLLRKLN